MRRVLLDVFVPGIPASQGSKRAFAYKAKATGQWRASTVDDNKPKLRGWRATVAGVVATAWEQAPLDGPVAMHLMFTMPRPKSHYTKKGLRPNAPHWCPTLPDRDKLGRAVADSLKGVVYADDKLVVDGQTSKVYGDRPGVHIVVEALDP